MTASPTARLAGTHGVAPARLPRSPRRQSDDRRRTAAATNHGPLVACDGRGVCVWRQVMTADASHRPYGGRKPKGKTATLQEHVAGFARRHKAMAAAEKPDTEVSRGLQQLHNPYGESLLQL